MNIAGRGHYGCLSLRCGARVERNKGDCSLSGVRKARTATQKKFCRASMRPWSYPDETVSAAVTGD